MQKLLNKYNRANSCQFCVRLSVHKVAVPCDMQVPDQTPDVPLACVCTLSQGRTDFMSFNQSDTLF